MGIRGIAWDKVKWKIMRERPGYTEEEMKAFRENPRYEDIVSEAPEWIEKTINRNWKSWRHRNATASTRSGEVQF